MAHLHFLFFFFVLISCQPTQLHWTLKIDSPQMVATNVGTVKIFGRLELPEKTSYPPLNGKVDCNGIQGEIHSSTFTWIVDKFPLQEGHNNIVCTYTDPKYVKSSKLSIKYVPHDIAPVAEAIIKPNIEFIPFEATLDASSSFDSDGQIVDYRWSIQNQEIGTEKILKYTFKNDGIYTVTLKVVDDEGVEGIKNFIITAKSRNNTKPYAAFEVNFYEGYAPLSVSFNASNSYDIDGIIKEYEWKILNKVVKTGVNYNYTFNEPGIYNVVLTVKDNKGDHATSSKLVYVKKPNIQVPEIVFSIDPTEPRALEKVILDARNSYLPGHESEVGRGIADCSWTYSNKNRLVGCRVEHQFSEVGLNKIRLEVTATNGEKSFADKTINVLPSQNSSLYVDFNMSPNQGIAPLVVSLNASPSYLPGYEEEGNRGIQKCSWSASKDKNQYTSIKSDQCVTTLNLAIAGEWTISLTAEAIDGQVASISKEVIVLGKQPNQNPVANFIFNDLGSGTVQFSSLSFDPDGTIVAYEWDMGDGSIKGGPTQEYTYETPGSYRVTLKVKDNYGATAYITKQVEVSFDQVPLANFEYTQTTETSPFQVEFDASASEGNVVSYVWNFGDGFSGNGKEVIHNYLNLGDYLTILTIQDSQGRVSVKSKMINVDMVNLEFKNAKFDEGSLKGWRYFGDVVIVSKCTFFVAECSIFELAAAVSTAAEDSSVSNLRQSFIVPANAIKITGKYRFLTNEIPPLVLKNFDDFFKITSTFLNETSVVAQGDVLTLPFGEGAGGYKYGSNIFNFEIPLHAYRGQKIKIGFEVQDAHDSLVDSALAITDLLIIQE